MTFVGRDEVVDHYRVRLGSRAGGPPEALGAGEVRRRLLDHPNQRFRFSYILGRTSGAVDSLDDVDDDDIDDDEPMETGLELIWQTRPSLSTPPCPHCGTWYRNMRQRFVVALADDDADERVLEEIIEETLDEVLRGDERFHAVVDGLFDEIEKRFALLEVGEIRRNRQGWPVVWSWSTDWADLVRAVTRFSSNYAPLFGSLLTPLVSGIRVAGPFAPTWAHGVSPSSRDHRRRGSRSHAKLRLGALDIGVEAN